MKQNRHQFGFIFTPCPTAQNNQKTIKKSCRNFINEAAPYIAKSCNIPQEEIITDCYYDTKTKEVKGMLLVLKPTSESTIDALYYYGKTVWRSQKTAPHEFSLFIDEKLQSKQDSCLQ